MNPIHAARFVIIVLGMPLSAATATSPWQWEQSVEITRPGLVRLDLAPETLDALQPGFEDARLISPDNVESPWVLETRAARPDRDIEGAGFLARLEGTSTILTARTRTADPVESITLLSPARTFLKSVRVETRNGTADWQAESTGHVIFRQPDGIACLRIPLPSVVCEEVRVILDDQRADPVPFTGLRFTLATPVVPTLEHPVRVISREDRPGTTRIELDLGAANLDLAHLEIETTEPLFSRTCSIAIKETATDETSKERPVGGGAIYRVTDESGGSTSSTLIPMSGKIPSRTIILNIANGSSPPLSIAGVRAHRHPGTLVFFAPQPGTWILRSGNPHAIAPRYDLEALRARLESAPATTVILGPLKQRPDFAPDPVLPRVAAHGAGIDLADWQFVRAIEGTGPGVVRIELDAPALANTQPGAADVRLIQAGRQIPYLVGPSRPLVINGTVTPDPDPDRPTISRWKVTLPVSDLPVHQVTVHSTASLFARRFTVRALPSDHPGHERMQMLGAADWTRTPGEEASATPLVIPVGQARFPAVFAIETDNGANAPIPIEDVRVHCTAPTLIAKIPDNSPLTLYYGNPRANLPIYDLRLVREELLRADARPLSPGPERTAEGRTSSNRRPGTAGSPWLWAALGLTVAALLWAVAKLLPGTLATRPPDGGS